MKRRNRMDLHDSNLDNQGCRSGTRKSIMPAQFRLPSVAVWGLLLVLTLVIPCPVRAAENADVLRFAHLESPRPNVNKVDTVVPFPADTRKAATKNPASGGINFELPHAHGSCLGWQPLLLWLHIGSDSLIALAYFSIPIALIVLVRRRQDLQFNWMFVLFGIFIMACGATHVMSIWTLWKPAYLAGGVVKAVTAVASLFTAVILWPLIPKALALPGPAQWEAVHGELRNEIEEHRKAEVEVRRLNAELEQRVFERTAELEATNRRLAEVNQGLYESEAQVRQSQCLLRAIIDNSAAIIYVKDLEGRYLLINRRYEDLFHVTQEAVAGKSDYDLFPREQAEAFRAFDQRVLAAGTVMEAEEVASHDDGLHTYLSIKAPLGDTEGKPYAVCGISADITERKRDEEEIRRLNAELQEKVVQLIEAQEDLVRKEKLAILGQLSGSVGHELRNPLGVMSNAVYFLQMVLADADETTKEYLAMIKNEIDISQRIISDLLDFARTKTPQTKAVTARELMNESLGKCAIPENVELRTEIPEDLPMVMIDPLQMGQVLQNFITNAVQAMPEGGSVRISARQVRGTRNEDEQQVRGTRNEERGNQDLNLEPRSPIPDPAFIEISIEDTGEGISPEGMKKLFQPLFTTKAKGIGLGLVVCKNLVEANGGRIEVESRPGEGTTFTVALPVENSEG